jgi:iron complex transport system substrate-binding protein
LEVAEAIMTPAERSSGSIALLVLLFLFAISATLADSREITDMAGRKVMVPDSIKKVYAPSAYGAYVMYSIDPTLLAGLIFPAREEDKKYLPRDAQSLPVIGSLFGQRQTGTIELLLKSKPDLIVLWAAKKSALDEKAETTLKKLNLPYVYAVAESMDDYNDVYLFLGRLLGREERTEKLASYWRKTLSEARAVISRIPPDRRLTVYYAEEADGLSTECDDSIHVELLKLTGDTNVHRCHASSHMGMEKLSLERVKLYNPDVIIAQETAFFDKVFKDPVWRVIKAVNEGRVYLIPRTPFTWFDRPPSFMRIIGLQWLMKCLYPNEYRIDIVKEAREFYKLFLQVDLSDEEIRNLVYP